MQLSWTDLSDVSLTFIDLAAGGCDLYSDRSCDIYLWSVTVDGQVFLRRNCTFQTAFHGDRWERVEALDGTEVSQVSCGAGGHVWVVTATGMNLWQMPPSHTERSLEFSQQKQRDFIVTVSMLHNATRLIMHFLHRVFLSHKS